MISFDLVWSCWICVFCVLLSSTMRWWPPKMRTSHHHHLILLWHSGVPKYWASSHHHVQRLEKAHLICVNPLVPWWTLKWANGPPTTKRKNRNFQPRLNSPYANHGAGRCTPTFALKITQFCRYACQHHGSHMGSIKYSSGWWYTYPSEKWWSSSVGMLFHSQLNGKSHNPVMFQTFPKHQPVILPSGKRLHNYMERSTIFNGKIHYFYGHVQ